MKDKKETVLTLTRKDFVFTYYNPPGPGGQAKNKTMNGVRCKHEPSGVQYSDHSTRSLRDNELKAFQKVANDPKFQQWLKIEHSKKCVKKEDINRRVDEQMQSKNIRVEVQDENGNWVDEKLIKKKD